MINCMSISEIKKEIYELMKSKFSEFIIIDEFNKNQFFGVCKNNYICIKLKEIKTDNISFQNYLDTGVSKQKSSQIFGQKANVKFEFLIYNKLNEDINLSDIFLEIYNLLSSYDDASFNHFSFSKTEYKENIQGFCTSVFVDCETIITAINQSNTISDVVVSYKK